MATHQIHVKPIDPSIDLGPDASIPGVYEVDIWGDLPGVASRAAGNAFRRDIQVAVPSNFSISIFDVEMEMFIEENYLVTRYLPAESTCKKISDLCPETCEKSDT